MDILKIICINIIFINSYSMLCAQLIFDKSVICDMVPSDLNQYNFCFKFQNTSSRIVNIIKIENTCSCIVTKIKDTKYQPGTFGKVDGIVKTQNSLGIIDQEIIVHTDDIAQPQVTLTLKIKILNPVEIKPRLVYWEKDAKLNEKVITITISDPKWKIESATCDNKKFILKNREDDTNKSKHSIVITPISTKKTMRDVIKIKLKDDKGTFKIFVVHALVK